MKNVSKLFVVLLMSCTLFFSIEATAQISSNNCANWNQVATSCVGACGSSSTISYPVLCVSSVSKTVRFCVRNEASSLCPNTGAVATVFIDGNPVSTSVITPVGSTISFSAKCGSKVKVVTTTYPLNNGIHCVWQGELTVGLRRLN